jgi:hypothetical protein
MPRFFLVLMSGAMLNFSNAASHKSATLADLKLANFEQLEGRFQQTKLLKELDLEIKTEGDFQVLRQPQNASVFRWNIQKPKVSKICIDSVGILIDSADGDPAKKKNLKFSEVGKEAGDQIASLLKIITMDQGKIGEEFEITPQGKTYLLTPKDPAKAFFQSANLEINGKGLAEKVTIREKSQDEIRIRFTDLKTSNTPAKEQKCPR